MIKIHTIQQLFLYFLLVIWKWVQTAPTQFIENYIYQPPWELIQQAAAKEQQIYDAAVASTKIFDNLQINLEEKYEIDMRHKDIWKIR